MGFGMDGPPVAASDLGEMKMPNGKQTYPVPASVGVDEFNEISIRWLRFSVPSGVAKLG